MCHTDKDKDNECSLDLKQYFIECIVRMDSRIKKIEQFFILQKKCTSKLVLVLVYK